MSYPGQPGSPTRGYFPSSPTTPFAFAAMQQQHAQSQRDVYNMYAELRSYGGQSAPVQLAHGGPVSPLKRFFRKL